MEYLKNKFRYTAYRVGEKAIHNPIQYSMDIDVIEACSQAFTTKTEMSLRLTAKSHVYIEPSQAHLAGREAPKQMLKHLAKHLFGDIQNDLYRLSYAAKYDQLSNDEISQKLSELAYSLTK